MSDLVIAYYTDGDLAMLERLATPGVVYVSTCEEEEDVD